MLNNRQELELFSMKHQWSCPLQHHYWWGAANRCIYHDSHCPWCWWYVKKENLTLTTVDVKGDYSSNLSGQTLLIILSVLSIIFFNKVTNVILKKYCLCTSKLMILKHKTVSNKKFLYQNFQLKNIWGGCWKIQNGCYWQYTVSY